MKKALIIILAIILLIGTVLFSNFRYRLYKLEHMKDTGDLQERIDKLGEAYVKTGNNVGLVIGIIQNDKVYIQGYGKTSKESNTKPDSLTLFELASVGKLFTTSALQVFADRGELSLDDNIKRYLSEKVSLPEAVKNTSLGQLATHTSGFPSIPDSFNSKMKDEQNPYKDLTKADMYEYLASCDCKKPDGQYKYSNFGMGLLGHIFELKYKDTYESIIKREICSKLVMKNTVITLDDEQKQLLAQGYDAEGNPNPVWEDSVLTGAGSFLSNAEDMIKFIEANLDESGSTISASLIKTQERQPNGATGLGWHYPMFGEKLLGLKDIIWHSGMAGGYSSYIAIDKNNDTGIIILSNTANDVRSLGVKIMLFARNISLRN